MTEKKLMAFAVTEPNENLGEIIFATSDIEARRRGADEYNDGDLGGMRVRRQRHFDKYLGVGVPVSDLVEEGWHFECCGCGLKMNEDTMEEAGLPIDGILGTQHTLSFCSEDCEVAHQKWVQARDAHGDLMAEKLREYAQGLLGEIEFLDGPDLAQIYGIR